MHCLMVAGSCNTSSKDNTALMPQEGYYILTIGKRSPWNRDLASSIKPTTF